MKMKNLKQQRNRNSRGLVGIQFVGLSLLFLYLNSTHRQQQLALIKTIALRCVVVDLHASIVFV